MDAPDTHVIAQVLSLARMAAIAAAVGWFANRLLDTGITTRGLPLLAGLFGIYLGSHLSFLRLLDGPTIAGQAVLPAFLGAMVVCSFLKLANLGMAGPRW